MISPLQNNPEDNTTPESKLRSTDRGAHPTKWDRVKNNVYSTLGVLLVSYFVVLHFDLTALNKEGLSLTDYKVKKVKFFFKFASLLWLLIVPLVDYYYLFGTLQIKWRKMWKAYAMFLVLLLFVIVIITLAFFPSGLALIEPNRNILAILIVFICSLWYLDSTIHTYFRNYPDAQVKNDIRDMEKYFNYIQGDHSISREEKSSQLNILQCKLAKKRIELEYVKEIETFYSRIVSYSDKLIFWCLVATIIAYLWMNEYLKTGQADTPQVNGHGISRADDFIEGALCFQAMLSTAIYLMISATFNRRLQEKNNFLEEGKG